MRPRQNGLRFADDVFKCISLNKHVWIVIKISLKFVPKCQINNIPVLFRKMAWRRSGAKPLSEPIMVRLPTHICVTRPQWVNSSDAEDGTFRLWGVNTMPAGALAPKVARSSAGMIMRVYDMAHVYMNIYIYIRLPHLWIWIFFYPRYDMKWEYIFVW